MNTNDCLEENASVLPEDQLIAMFFPNLEKDVQDYVAELLVQQFHGGKG